MSKAKRKLRPIPKLIITVFVLFIVFLFFLGIWDTFFRASHYPMAYKEEITAACEEFGIDVETVFATIYCESSFNKEAVSNMNARGLMQLLPDTFEWLCTREGVEYDEEMLFDPATNIRYGTMFLSILYDRYENWDAVHAAYHAGHGRVDGWFERGEVIIDADGNLTGIPIDATSVYVERINSAKKVYTELLAKEKK